MWPRGQSASPVRCLKLPESAKVRQSAKVRYDFTLYQIKRKKNIVENHSGLSRTPQSAKVRQSAADFRNLRQADRTADCPRCHTAHCNDNFSFLVSYESPVLNRMPTLSGFFKLFSRNSLEKRGLRLDEEVGSGTYSKVYRGTWLDTRKLLS